MLTEKDLHCLARVLQGCMYMDGDVFYCCKYCLYQKCCDKEASEGKVYFTNELAKKLQDITGVYLGINICNIKDKLLQGSNQVANKRVNMR